MLANDFLQDVAEFRSELDRSKGWDDLRTLWAKNIEPYRLLSSDPLSAEYRSEILEIYEKMTSSSYQLDNEMTSTKIAPADFARGYPWMTNNLGTAAVEMAKVVQAFRVMQTFVPTMRRVVEFGSGWANLALSLAQIGLDVTAVDIDEGFLLRTETIAKQRELHVHTLKADFLTAARAANGDFDAVIFQSSFHHCLDFNELLGLLRKALTTRGRVFFFSEPIFPRYPFPWGLRTDGESIWAITSNKWLELGFDRDFFMMLLHSHGFLGTATGAIANILGDAWVATPAEIGLPFEQWSLPSRYDDTFHAAGEADHGRFLRARSVLPVPARGSAVLTMANFGLMPLSISMSSGTGEAHAKIPPGEERDILLDGARDEIHMRADTFVPNDMSGNGDTRHLGPALRRVSFS